MKEYSYYNRIVDYLEGDLSDDQRLLFKEELKNNPRLKQEYDLFLEAQSMTEALQYTYLKKTVGSFQQNAKSIDQPVPIIKSIPFWRKPLAIAASILLLSIASVFTYANLNYSPQKLALHYYTSPNFSSERSTTQGKNLLDKATEAINNQDYNKATQSASQINKNSSDYLPGQYVLAHALMQNNKWSTAQDRLVELVQTQDLRYLESAQWYLALAYLKNGDSKNSLQLLEQIILQKAHGYHADAVALKTKLDSRWRSIVF